MEPVRLALIGAGRRMRSVYLGLLPHLGDAFAVSAVCDPLESSAIELAKQLEVPAFRSLRDMVRARPMEAALIVAPGETHHALSVYLSRHGVPHMCETPLAPTLAEARAMVSEAEAQGVLLQVNEQFFRRDLLAFWKSLAEEGVIGDVGRAVCLNGHLGYHTNSIFQGFAGSPVASVNAVAHAMPVQRYFDVARRWNESEDFEVRFISFENGFAAMDSAANVKGALGRCPRPGYLEIDGARGAFVEAPVGPWPWESRAEVRIVPDENYETGGHAISYPILAVIEKDGVESTTDRIPYKGPVKRLAVRLPDGERTYENPTASRGLLNNYLSSTAQACLEFATALRTGATLSYPARAALESGAIDAAAALSLEHDGVRVRLPLERGPVRDAEALDALRLKLGVDPLDVDAMLDVAFPKNYVAAN